MRKFKTFKIKYSPVTKINSMNRKVYKKLKKDIITKKAANKNNWKIFLN